MISEKKYEKVKKKKLKQTHTSAHLVQYMFKIREGSLEGIRMTMELPAPEHQSPVYSHVPAD